MPRHSSSLVTRTEAQFVEWTLAADFLMDPQWRMSSVAMSFNVGNDGTSVSVNANLGASNSQCVSVGGSNTIGGFCVPLTPAQSGTITLTLDLRSDKVCPTCFTDSSGFGNGAITLNQVFVPDSVPEPSTIVLLGLGAVPIFFASRRGAHCSCLMNSWYVARAHRIDRHQDLADECSALVGLNNDPISFLLVIHADCLTCPSVGRAVQSAVVQKVAVVVVSVQDETQDAPGI